MGWSCGDFGEKGRGFEDMEGCFLSFESGLHVLGSHVSATSAVEALVLVKHSLFSDAAALARERYPPGSAHRQVGGSPPSGKENPASPILSARHAARYPSTKALYAWTNTLRAFWSKQ